MPRNRSPNRLPRAFVTALCLMTLAACGPRATNPTPPQASAQAPPEQGFSSSASLLVRFRDPHPFARAQALEAEGRCAEAAQLARETLATRPDLAGLCFERFTVGGAEIVLAACTPPADGQAFQHAWVERLRAMADVEYAEANVVTLPESCPP